MKKFYIIKHDEETEQLRADDVKIEAGCLVFYVEGSISECYASGAWLYVCETAK